MSSTMRMQVIFLLLVGVAVSTTIADQRRLDVPVYGTFADNAGSCLRTRSSIVYGDALELLNLLRTASITAAAPTIRLAQWQKGKVMVTYKTAKLVISSVYGGYTWIYWKDLMTIAVDLVQDCLEQDDDGTMSVYSGVKEVLKSTVLPVKVVANVFLNIDCDYVIPPTDNCHLQKQGPSLHLE